MKRYLHALLFLPLAFLLAGCQTGVSDNWQVSVGDPAPSFQLPGVDGKTYSLEDVKGKPVAISIFATWCPPCRMELPDLQARIYERMKEKGVAAFAISGGEDMQTVKQFAEQAGLTLPILVDSAGTAVENFGGQYLPRMVILDKDHKVHSLHVGYSPESFDKVVAEVEELAK